MTRACSRLISPSDCLSENRTMQLTAEQFEQIAPWLPRQRGNVRLANLQVVNAILFVAANGCKWRALPGHYGPWHSIYMRMSRWAKAGVLNQCSSNCSAKA